MRNHWKRLALGTAAAAVLAVGLAISPASADDGLVRTTFPSAHDPGVPAYARIEPGPPHVPVDDGWAAMIFYRDPACIPPDFNLLTFFAAPMAFGCPLHVEGSTLWHGAPFNGAPKSVRSYGTGAVPVWFAPAASIEDAAQDGILTIVEVAALDGLVIGSADQFNEILHPHPEPSFGGGGHPATKNLTTARGQLEDGRQFSLQLTEKAGVAMMTRIAFS